ncbi:MAG: serine protease [Burkholderiaceae bacterium]|nr:serine protease [Burkholderiaceae bacterium]
MRLIILALASAFAVQAKANSPAELVPPKVTLLAPVGAAGQELNVRLSVDSVKIGLLPGDELGHTPGGIFCQGTKGQMVSEPFIKNYGNFITMVATQELKRLGYPLADLGKSSAFDTDVNNAPDFRVGGILKDIKLEICMTGPRAEGWVYYKVDWALYSEREQKVVFQKTTEGLAQSEDKVLDLPKRALITSVDNFLAAPEFLAALKAKNDAPQPQGKLPGAGEDAQPGAAVVVTTDAAHRSLMLTEARAPSGGVQAAQARLRDAVVTLETSAGSGSGFYIDRSGYLLTDLHVVRGAKFAKVRLQNGDKLVAQVVKVNEQADVALLKTPSIEFDPLAVRRNALDVGEDVYAIGTPLGVLTNSVTKGVLSADRVMKGVHVLQSDAAVTFGSSGGPLLDLDGRVIGLTRSGLKDAQGFNFFVPIQDALQALDIGFNRP